MCDFYRPLDVHRVSKNYQCCFLNNSVKRWPILIIFGMQHRKQN